MNILEKLKEVTRGLFALPVVKISPTEMALAMRMMVRLIKVHGWCEEAAATATSMAMAESGFRSGVEGDKNLSDSAHGMWQWRGARFKGLEDYAKKTAMVWTDFNTQVDYFNAERLMRTKLEKSWHTLKDIHEGCIAGYDFERYSGHLQPKREAYAKEFLFEWQGRR